MSDNPLSGAIDRRDFAIGLGAMLALGFAPSGGVAEDRIQSSAGTKEAVMKSKGIYPETVKAADASYSPGILAEGTQVLFVSGQGPRDLKAEPEVQIRQTLEKIQTVLQTAGASWRNVVMIRSYFVNLKRDLPLFRKVRREFLVEPYPASTAIGVTELATPDLQIEIEAIAIL